MLPKIPQLPNMLIAQEGAILIFLMIVLALLSTVFAINSTTGIEFKTQRDIKTGKALSEAKQAILGWSVAQNNPGQLPCPEDTNLIGSVIEGQAKSSCSLPAIGRLPWRTLGIGDIRDGNNDRLWYVISTGFRTPPINTNNAAGLSVDGVTNYVAIIFSPGMSLLNQSREIPTAASPPNVTQYLDLSNSDGDSAFISTSTSSQFNDTLITISKNELFTLVAKRILREVRGDNSQGLVDYYMSNGLYPFADTNNDGAIDLLQFNGTPTYQGHPLNLYFSSTIKNTLLNNGWFPLINYNLALTAQSVNLTLYGNTLTVSP